MPPRAPDPREQGSTPRRGFPWRRAFANLVLLSLCGVGACGDGPRRPEDALLVEIDRLLDQVDTEEFFAPTWIASGHGTVRSVILAQPAAEGLIRHGERAVHRMLDRLKAPDRLRRTETKAAVFVMLGRMGSRDAVPQILSYLEGLPNEDVSGSLSPWHPFGHALDALRSLLPGLDVSEDLTTAFATRHEIVARARAVL